MLAVVRAAEIDVLVVGSGAAGLSAAVSAERLFDTFLAYAAA